MFIESNFSFHNSMHCLLYVAKSGQNGMEARNGIGPFIQSWQNHNISHTEYCLLYAQNERVSFLNALRRRGRLPIHINEYNSHPCLNNLCSLQEIEKMFHSVFVRSCPFCKTFFEQLITVISPVDLRCESFVIVNLLLSLA